MRRKAGFFFLGLFLGACGAGVVPPPASPPPSEPVVSVGDLKNKTVALAYLREDGSARAYCSGVWVGDKTIVTAYHCLDEELLAEGFAGVLYAVEDDVLDGNEPRGVAALRLATVSAMDPEHDLALLTAQGQVPFHGIARIALDRIAPGEKVSTMGHPYGLWWSYSTGDIAAIRRMDLDPEIIYVQTTAPTSKGNSGCGLFDSQGYLIGIAHAGIPAGSNLAFYVHGRYVQDLLRGLPRV